MGCHMVFTVKRLSDGAIEKFKCRLVANGNTQKEGVDFDRIFSTVVKITTIRVVLAIAAARDYNLTSIDVQQAFLQGTLEEDLYMQMPPGLPSRSADGRRIVVTGYAGTRHRVLIVDFDPVTGDLEVDASFTANGVDRPGVSFDRVTWPHGESGPGDPHGAVFSRPTGS